MSLYSRIGIFTISIALGWNCSVSKVNAQGLGNSPYSSLGMGELYNDAFSGNTGMGQAGVSVGSPFQINNLNPALWIRNKYTTLDFGVIGQYKDIVSGSKNQQNAGGNLAYVALSFSPRPKWSIGLSLKPYSFVDYENTSVRNIAGTPMPAYYFNTGKGGLNKVSITNAFQVGKYLSLGLESSYFFGNIRRSSEAQIPFQDGANYLVSLNERTIYGDIAFRGGAALRIPIKKDRLNFNAGAAYSIGTEINANQTTSFELTQNSFNVVKPDTLNNNHNGSITLPSQYQVGVSLEWPYRLTVAVDYSHQSWSQYRSFARTNDGLKDASRFHVGLDYIPRFGSLSYVYNIRYKLGFSHGQTPYTVNGRGVKDSNVSLGFSFPIGRELINGITISLVGGQRGVAGNGMIRERYGRLVLGLTLMEPWFIKRKID